MKAVKSSQRRGGATDNARKKVRAYCAENKVSMRAFAEMSSCSLTTLNRFMAGKIHGRPCPGNKSMAFVAIKRFFKNQE